MFNLTPPGAYSYLLEFLNTTTIKNLNQSYKLYYYFNQNYKNVFNSVDLDNEYLRSPEHTFVTFFPGLYLFYFKYIKSFN
jgi:hypothetical protein